VQYVGFILSEDGISASSNEVKALRKFPTAKSVKDVRTFIEVASFYRRLLLNFARVAKSLTGLTRKDQKFN